MDTIAMARRARLRRRATAAAGRADGHASAAARVVGELRRPDINLDWAAGSGDVVRGPGEAVLMAMAGRADALADLDGPGVRTLARVLR